jgi:hypothetical protein
MRLPTLQSLWPFLICRDAPLSACILQSYVDCWLISVLAVSSALNTASIMRILYRGQVPSVLYEALLEPYHQMLLHLSYPHYMQVQMEHLHIYPHCPIPHLVVESQE